MKQQYRTGITTIEGNGFLYEQCDEHHLMWKEGDDFVEDGGSACAECVHNATTIPGKERYWEKEGEAKTEFEDDPFWLPALPATYVVGSAPAYSPILRSSPAVFGGAAIGSGGSGGEGGGGAGHASVYLDEVNLSVPTEPDRINIINEAMMRFKPTKPTKWQKSVEKFSLKKALGFRK